MGWIMDSPTSGHEGSDHDAVANPSPEQSRKIPLIILGLIAALVLVATLAIVFTRAEPARLAESTPAGVVQRYSAAALAGDESTAASFLTEGVRANCPRMEQFRAENLTIALVSTTERIDSADVGVSIAHFSANGPFGPSESRYEADFSLVKEAGAWRIVSAPWELTICPNEGLK